MGKNCIVCKFIDLLVGVGALNWGLVTFVNFNLVTRFLGEATTATKVVYGLVGLAGLLKLISLVRQCPCTKKCQS